MTNKEIEKYEQDLTGFVNESRSVGNLTERHSALDNLLPKFQALAATVGSPWLSVDLMNANTIGIQEIVANLEHYIEELTNNIRISLQTKMMLNACVSAEQSATTAQRACKWAAVAAIVSVLGVVGTWVTVLIMVIIK
jgi:hypothetical protein